MPIQWPRLALGLGFRNRLANQKYHIDGGMSADGVVKRTVRAGDIGRTRHCCLRFSPFAAARRHTTKLAMVRGSTEFISARGADLDR